MTLTGVPESASSDPALAVNATGIRNRDGGTASRTAMTTTTGSSAATAPVTVISADRTATSSSVSASSRP